MCSWIQAYNGYRFCTGEQGYRFQFRSSVGIVLHLYTVTGVIHESRTSIGYRDIGVEQDTGSTGIVQVYIDTGVVQGYRGAGVVQGYTSAEVVQGYTCPGFVRLFTGTGVVQA